MSYNISQIQSLLRQAGWPENQIAKASAIVMYESNGNPNAINDGSAGTNEYSVGLLQINTKSHNYPVASLKDPIYNLQVALKIWQGRPSYADWYNSNIKYENDYKGIASQALAVYNAGGGNNVIDTADVPQILDNTGNTLVAADTTDNSAMTILYVALAGFAAIMIMRR